MYSENTGGGRGWSSVSESGVGVTTLLVGYIPGHKLKTESSGVDETVRKTRVTRASQCTEGRKHAQTSLIPTGSVHVLSEIPVPPVERHTDSHPGSQEAPSDGTQWEVVLPSTGGKRRRRRRVTETTSQDKTRKESEFLPLPLLHFVSETLGSQRKKRTSAASVVGSYL